MKITLIRQDSGSGKEALSICEAGTLFNKMKTETKSGHITALRELIPMLEGTYSQYEHIDKLPYIYSAVEYTRTKEGERKMKQYNGLVQLEVKRLAGLSEMEFVKRQAALLPQTFAAFCGSSDRSVKIWVRFALPDDRGLPEKEAEAELFHAHAYWLAVKCYQPILLPYDIALKEPVLTQKCRMTLDESPYYNPDAVPFCLEQPLTMPGEETFRQRKQGEKNLLSRLQPGYESAKTFTKIYEAALNRAFQEMENWKRGDDLQPLLVHLTEQCFKSGIPEEEAVRQTLIHYYREEDERTIRSTIHNLYQECKGFGKKSSIGREQETAFLMEEFMNRRYEFRYNTVLDDLEYRQRDSIHFYFKPVDKRVRNSISICALKEGINAWDRDVDRFLNSEYVPLYNPVEEYLYSAMEDYRIDIMIDKGPSARSIQIDLNPFTLVGATTRSGLLTAPLRARFGINLHLEYYDDDILSNIIRRSASILDVPCSLRAAGEIASRSRGTPRIANALLRRVRDYAQVKGSGSIDAEIAQLALEALNIDKYGLDEIDNKILCTIIDKFKGGPVGITTIATALGEDAGTIEEVYEPFLIKEGFMKRTPRGRVVTELAFKHLGRCLYNSQKTLFND